MPTNFTDAQLYEEYNRLSSFELCIIAQESIQDSVYKIAEFVTILKATNSSTLYGDNNTFLQRRQRLEDTIGTFELYFQRLRIIGTIVHQRKLALDQNQAELSINNNNKVYLDQLRKEKEDLAEELKLKNAYLKLSIDKLAEIIWQINSMQKLR